MAPYRNRLLPGQLRHASSVSHEGFPLHERGSRSSLGKLPHKEFVRPSILTAFVAETKDCRTRRMYNLRVFVPYTDDELR